MSAALKLVGTTAAPEPETLEAERDRLGHAAADLLTAERSRDPGTGFADVDRIIGPFAPGKLVIVLARPSMGKTTFAMGIASRPAWRERGFVYFPTEEEGAAAQLRYAAACAGVHPGNAVEGLIPTDEKERVARALAHVRTGTAFFRDMARPTVMAVQKAAHDAAERGLSLLIVDHAHRMALAETESQRVSLEQTIRALKDVAVQARVTLLLMAQAKRPTGKLDRMSCPGLSDGSGTAAIEQEGDTVLGLFRPLVKGLNKADREDFNSGQRPVTDAIIPHVMGVEVLKFRRNGDKVGEQAWIDCRDGLLSNRTAREAW